MKRLLIATAALALLAAAHTHAQEARPGQEQAARVAEIQSALRGAGV